MEIRRTMFVDSASSTAVQLRRHPFTSPLDDTCAGRALHQVNIVTGINSATTVEAGAGAFWQTGCVLYDVIIRRRG